MRLVEAIKKNVYDVLIVHMDGRINDAEERAANVDDLEEKHHHKAKIEAYREVRRLLLTLREMESVQEGK